MMRHRSPVCFTGVRVGCRRLGTVTRRQPLCRFLLSAIAGINKVHDIIVKRGGGRGFCLASPPSNAVTAQARTASSDLENYGVRHGYMCTLVINLYQNQVYFFDIQQCCYALSL